jgi:hypothetical protein
MLISRLWKRPSRPSRRRTSAKLLSAPRERTSAAAKGEGGPRLALDQPNREPRIASTKTDAQHHEFLGSADPRVMPTLNGSSPSSSRLQQAPAAHARAKPPALGDLAARRGWGPADNLDEATVGITAHGARARHAPIRFPGGAVGPPGGDLSRPIDASIAVRTRPLRARSPRRRINRARARAAWPLEAQATVAPQAGAGSVLSGVLWAAGGNRAPRALCARAPRA